MSQSREAFRSANLFDQGMGYVVVARFHGATEAEVGGFLIDAHCLGVKDAFYVRLPRSEYHARVLGRLIPEAARLALTPATARKLVEAAVAYAAVLGFAPHPDYKKACRVLGGIDPRESAEEFTFGRDGKPLYVQGPHDSVAMADRVMRQLRAHCGADGFHYVLLLGGPAELESDEND
jgi:hypothetical protein